MREPKHSTSTDIILQRIDGFESRYSERATDVDRRLAAIEETGKTTTTRVVAIEDFVLKCTLGRRWLLRGLYVSGAVITFVIMLGEKLPALIERYIQWPK